MVKHNTMRRRPSQRGTALLAAMVVTLAVTALSMMAARGAILEARSARVFADGQIFSGAGEEVWAAGQASLTCQIAPEPNGYGYDSSGTGSMALRCGDIPVPLSDTPAPVYPGHEVHAWYEFDAPDELSSVGSSTACSVGSTGGSEARQCWYRYEVRAFEREGETVTTGGGTTAFLADWEVRLRGYSYTQLTTGDQ